jgi:hypothetical protein
VILKFLVVVMLSGSTAEDIDVSMPKQVAVRPVFFVPQGETPPTKEQKARLMKHLKWSQDRYQEMLGNRDTFRIAKTMPDVYRAKKPLAFYKQLPATADGISYSSHFVGELLDHFGQNRFNCPYILLIVVMNPHEDFPVGGGRPCNGGFNRGCGLLNLSSYALDKIPNFQSTLQHELGHAFGLPHVDVYGYDMKTSPSIMSYNPAHHTDGFRASKSPGRLISEDIRGLALNRRCFADLRFDPANDAPEGQKLYRVVWLGPMEIVGQPSYDIEVTTPSGSTFASKPINIVQRDIRPSKGPGVTYDAARMWQSDVASSGWVSLDVTFPVAVTLTKIGIYTQHSGQYHAAQRVRIQVESEGEFRDVVEQDLENVDAAVPMPATRGQRWRIHLRAGESKMVVVRGLRFSAASGGIFPPAVPYASQ